ncbi:sugar phosphate isomerase/epimerase family protein [Hufsiella ginkgonis]|uniref:TIM barrel protein n=1 Tax=Hufsiella ginkgonis TaxID=2695274 RepID=A0A7K1XXR4_9SPHI|nr:sugar phosphate isomerase/epimerase [Hufsiella ginkgonis]MXV15723.1 TIM barrel protein [Hufsiella ginkgonis]
MIRRTFLHQLTALAAGCVVLPSFIAPERKVKNIGVQLYTFRDSMMKDARGTLEQVAGLGIKQIESAGSAKGNYYGLKPKEIKEICTALGMTLRSGHVHIDGQWKKTIAEAAEAGQEYLICSSMPTSGQTVSNYRKTADTFNKAGEECKKMGLKFGYHNHDYEFGEENGQVLYDVLLSDTDPKLVNMELDLGWVIASGKDPLAYFKNHPGRFPLWHLKDMDLAKKRSTEFGKGGLDIAAMLDHGKESGLRYFFVEQEEYASSPLESMKHNVNYLQKLS